MVQNTPQEEWIRRRGVLLWLAFFFIELGAGIFFMSSIFGSLFSTTSGWVICAVLGGGLHLIFLGRPSRFWRMALSSGWKTSWISRGLIFVSLFLILSLIYIALDFWTGSNSTLLIISDILALLTIIYGGFAMNYINGIPLWNSALLPVLFLFSGLWGGAEVTLGLSLANADTGMSLEIEEWIRVLLIGFILLIPVYLVSVRHSSLTGRVSVRYLIWGKQGRVFWPLVVVVGMMIPLSAVIYTFAAGLKAVPLAFLYIAIIGGLIGDLALRNLILRCGLYSPLVPSSKPQSVTV
jgi:sulfite dehydrogenase (quinone) subunit SoeC